MSTLSGLASREYAYGFVTDIDTDLAPRGPSEEVIRLISAKKEEPGWLLDWRLRAYRHWLTLSGPTWQNVRYGPVDYDDIIYYAAPKQKAGPASLDGVDPELRAMFDKLGISLAEQERLSAVAVDAVVSSWVSLPSFTGPPPLWPRSRRCDGRTVKGPDALAALWSAPWGFSTGPMRPRGRRSLSSPQGVRVRLLPRLGRQGDPAAGCPSRAS
jgi:hypothetical protein